VIIHPAQLIAEKADPPKLRRADLVQGGPFGEHAARWLGPISFFVAGEPVAQPRPRARAIPGTHGARCRCGRKWTAQLYEAEKDERDAEGRITVRSAKPWRDLVALVGRSKQPPRPLQGTLALGLTFFFHAPQYVLEWGTPLPCLMPRRPDFDNLDKAVTDAMTDAGWWWDDGQIAWPLTPKFWIGPDQSEGVLVEVWYLEQPEPSRGLFPGDRK